MRKFLVVLLMSALLLGAFAATASAARGPRGPRGPRGFTGKTGPGGPVGPVGPAGVNGTNGTGGVGPSLTNFNGYVPFNGTKTLTVGQFTVREDAGAAACGPVQIINNSAFNADLVSTTSTAANDIIYPSTLGPAGVATVVAAGTYQPFTVVLVNGTSGAVGQISDTTLSGTNGCLTAGFVVGQ